MDVLGALQSFTAAIRTGSLSGAARVRELSQPAVSQQISALESYLGFQLLRRGRAGVEMTEAGRIVSLHAAVMENAYADLRAGLDTLSVSVSGRIVVTANPGLSQHILSDVIIDLRNRHPDLKVVLRADARLLDPEADGIDIALRSGGIGSGSGIARKIGTMANLHVATPDYLDATGRPTAPGDLINLDYIQFKAGDDQIATVLERGNEVIQTPIKVGFTAEHPELIVKALKGNLGFAKLPAFFVADDIRAKRLEVVLPKWSAPGTELFVVFPDRDWRRPNYLAFMGALLDRLEAVDGVDILPSANSMRA